MWSSRGAISQSLGAMLGSEALGLRLHPSLLIERRDAARGLRLYMRDGCDAGTVLLVLPQASAISLPSLRRLGVAAHVRLPDEAERNSGNGGAPATLDPVGRLLGARSQREWVEFAWRLAVERTARQQSLWWAWLELCQQQQRGGGELENARRRQHRVEFSVRAPHLADDVFAAAAALDASQERLVSESLLLTYPLLPPRDSWRWAIQALLRRTVLVPDGDSSAFQPAILPMFDFCSHAALSSRVGDTGAATNVVVSLLGGDDSSNAHTNGRLPGWVYEELKSEIASETREIEARERELAPGSTKVGESKCRRLRGPGHGQRATESVDTAARMLLPRASGAMGASAVAGASTRGGSPRAKLAPVPHRVRSALLGVSTSSARRGVAAESIGDTAERRHEARLLAQRRAALQLKRLELSELEAPLPVVSDSQRSGFFCLEAVAPLRPGDELRLDWLSMSPAAAFEAGDAAAFYSFVRFRDSVDV